MILKFRAWIKEEKCFADYIETIRYYAKEIDLCWGGICESDCFDFEDVIFTQSTGLKDKNGKEIFEGDIVTDGDVISDIKYHQTLGFYMIGKYGFSVPFGQGVDVEYFEEFAVHVSKTFEVIGNIYENQELLEGEE